MVPCDGKTNTHFGTGRAGGWVAVFEKEERRGSWVAQSVKRQILGFSSGHDLMVHEFKPCSGLCADRAEPAWDSFSAPPLLMLSLSLCVSEEINDL